MKGETRNGGAVFYACFEDLTQEVAWTVHIRGVVNNWVAMGSAVILFCPSIFPFKFPPNSKVVYVPTVNVRIVGEYLYLLLLPFYILLWGIKERPKALYCREMSLMIFLFLACKIIRVPMIIEVNGFLFDEMKLIGASSFKSMIFRIFQWINFNIAHDLVFVAAGLAEKYKKLYNLETEKMYVVPNGVDTDLFSPGDRDAAIENIIENGPFKLNPKSRYITFVGSFYPHSLTPIIVEAARHVAQERDDVVFLMIGDGHDLPLCRKIVDENKLNNRVLFLDVRPHSEIPDYIRISSVLLYITGASPEWRSSFKILEYMSSGGAAISNLELIFGVPLTHNKNYFFIEEPTPKLLSNAIIELIDNDKLRKVIGQGARELIVENFSWRKTAERLLYVIDGVIDGGGK